MSSKEATRIDELFAEVVKRGGSDLHLVVGREPHIRVDGKLTPTKHAPLTAKAAHDLVSGLLTLEQQTRFEQERELDFGHQIASGDRFRVNLHWEKGAVGLAARLIPREIPPPEAIGLTPAMRSLLELPNGLILITGPTGSGKSTTLASMINAINLASAKNIVTLEDPVEFVFPIGPSLVRQREVGTDTKSFPEGLRRLLRQDPNIIMVGEMRDLETITTTLTLAETGHLVFATLHTNNAASTIARIIDVFPPSQQTQIRVQLAMSLRAVLSQQLLAKKDGGRVAVREFLVSTPAIANLIRENKPEQITSVIQTSGKLGMFTLEQDLKRQLSSGEIAAEDAARFGIEK